MSRNTQQEAKPSVVENPAVSFISPFIKGDGLLVAGIFLVALALRFYGINFGLPYVYHADEPFYVLHALKFGQGDLNPHWFFYPTLYMYLLFFLYGIFFLLGLLSGVFHSARDVAVLYFTDPTAFHLMGRTATALLGSLTVVVVYFIGRSLFSRPVGVIAAFFFAFYTTHVEDSHYATSDVLMTFLVALSLYFSVRVVQEGKPWHYGLSGVLGGLAIATKYNAYPVAIPLLVAHLLRAPTEKRTFLQRLLDKKLWLGGVAFLLGFFVGAPFTFLDFSGFYPFFLGHLEQAKAGWLGPTIETPLLLPLTSFLPRGIGIYLEIVALVGVIYGAVYKRTRGDYLAISFMIAYYLATGGSRLDFARYWMPFVLLLLVLGARLLTDLVNLIAVNPSGKKVILSAVCIALVSVPLYRSLDLDYTLTLKDTRTIAKEWIELNIPAGTKIALDKDGPPISQSKQALRDEYQSQVEYASETPEARSHKVTPSEPLGNKELFYKLLAEVPKPEPTYYAVKESSVANKSLGYYKKEGFQYIIVQTWIRDLFYASGDRFPSVVNFYQELDKTYPKIQEFFPKSGGSRGPGILIYRLPPE